MSKTLYLVRHTAPRIAPAICYGQLDLDVAASFDAEAQQVLSWLPTAELILTSPLLRARKLAEYLARTYGCAWRCDARLMEKSFGAWEGKLWDEIERREVDAWAADVMGYAPPGGESARQLMERVQLLLQDVARLPQESLVMVTHGGIIRAALAELGRLPLPATLKWEVAYGAVLAVRL